ncbi:MAG: hypothetical protein EOP06_24660 [Proteobacteria bacterium]|nr:MAG: hypothetical protein EOP06_24660 [Pseudomonadota bacterium]
MKHTMMDAAGNALPGDHRYWFTLAHEVGHILTNGAHAGDQYDAPRGLTMTDINHDLIRNGTLRGNDVDSTKRWYGFQEGKFLEDLLINPR